jgi:hypothetical protein
MGEMPILHLACYSNNSGLILVLERRTWHQR